MPGYARKDIVREGEIGIYHTWSRCVQRAFLCGFDPLTGIDFDYRRDWIKSLLQYQASVFAVEVGNYSILSNHQHLIARTRPDIAARWSDEEVAWRWRLAWPSWIDGQWVREPTDEEIAEILAQPEKIPNLRANLASLSWFMARCKEPIARLANAEMDRKGHFYEQRFGSRELLDDAANFCCNIYVDLNQIKAGMARSLEECRCSAIYDRLGAWRAEEVQASLEAFHTNDPDGSFTLEAGHVERLLADCFLAPIGDQGPPLLEPVPRHLILPASPAKKTTLELPVPSATESLGQEISQPVPDGPVIADPAETTAPAASDAAAVPATAATDEGAAAAEGAPTAEPQSTGKGRGRQPRDRPVSTRSIHKRLQFRRRKRASDHVYLGIPREQYLELVCWSAERALAERTGEPQSRPPPEKVARILRQWGIAPDYWCEAIDKFANWFRRAVGHKDHLAVSIQRRKQRWIQGIRPCRQVFT